MRESESFFGLITKLGITEVIIDLIFSVTYLVGVCMVFQMTTISILFGLPVIVISLYHLKRNLD
jgi:hypothetical protein